MLKTTLVRLLKLSLIVLFLNCSNLIYGQIVINNLPNGIGSFQDVVANASAGATITFALGIEAIVLNNEILINKDLTIEGNVVSIF